MLKKNSTSEIGANPRSSSGANPSPTSHNRSEVVEVTEASSTVTLSFAIKKKRLCRTTTEEREAKKDEFIEMCRLNSLSMQENAEAERQQRREEQRANWELMQMIGTILASTAAAWASGNKTASAVFRPGND